MTAPLTRNAPGWGVAYGLAAYSVWSLAPLYWRFLAPVGAVEIVLWRVVLAAAFLVPMVWLSGDWRATRAVLASRRQLWPLLLTSVLISINWWVFIWGVNTDRVLEVSLGYYINPLVNVLLGVTVLRERLSRWQGLSVALAVAGVVVLSVSMGGLPWIALSAAFSFGFYGLLRKIMPVDALTGLTVETILLTPVFGALLIWLLATGQSAVPVIENDTLFALACIGVVTALPLLWFHQAAKRLRYATVGLLQYIAPSGHFLLAVFLFGEPFTLAHLVTFACIWTALIVFSVDTSLAHRRALRATPPGA